MSSILECCMLTWLVLTPALLAAAVPSADNAALRYWQAWSMMGDDVLFSRLDHEIGEYDPEMVIFDSDGQPLESDEHEPWTAEFLLERESYNIALLLRATGIEQSNFGVDYDAGFDALLPHLTPMRFSARLLLMDADRLMSEGEPVEAAKRCAAVIRMSQHLTMDALLINSMVSFSLFEWADLWIDEHREQLDDDSREIIAKALVQVSSNDPFGLLAAINNERDVFGSWLRAKLDAEWATPEDFDVCVRDSPNWDPSFRSLIDPVRQAAPNEYRDFLIREIAGYERFMAHAASLWQLTGRDDEMEELFASIDAGDFGKISAVIAPPVHRLSKTETQLRDRLQSVRDWAID